MSQKGESDLDVFKALGKSPDGPPSRTLIGQGPASEAPPPPPTNAPRAPTAPPPVARSAAETDMTDDVELLDELGDDDLDAEELDAEELTADALQILSAPPSGGGLLAGVVPPPGLAPAPAQLSPPSRPSLPPPSAPGSSLPPPVPSLPPPAPPPPKTQDDAAPTAMDWDDEDDQTTVFSRSDLDNSVPPLLDPTVPRTSGVPAAPPPPMSRPSAPVPTAPHQTIASLRRASNPVSTPAPASVPPTAAGSRMPLVFAAVAAAAIALALFFLLRPTGGGLIITVAGPVGEPLDEVQVLVDGKAKCATSPCKLEELQAGTHMVRATAAGHRGTADQAVVISGGQEAVVNIKLERAAGTGLRISANGSGHTLFIDNKEMGPLPQELKDLPPGDHVITVKSEQFEEWKQTITIRPNEMETIGPLKLKVLMGLAHIRAGGGADGARIVLESGGDRRSLPKPPVNVSIDTSKPHTLIATKRGFETFREVLAFDDGEAEKTFEIVMNQEAGDEPPRARAPRYTPPAPRAAEPSSSTAGNGTLNVNSIPASQVLLDGRPLGTTPKMGISVSAGPHTVVFSKDGQRKSKSVTVKAGQAATVTHRFK